MLFVIYSATEPILETTVKANKEILAYWKMHQYALKSVWCLDSRYDLLI